MAIYHNIAIYEPSDIICEGIMHILRHSELQYKIIRLDDLESCMSNGKDCQNSIDMLIVNPLIFLTNKKELVKIQKANKGIYIVALISNTMAGHDMKIYDGTISVFDTSEHIVSTISLLLSQKKKKRNSDNNENLSEREMQILVKLIHGMTNKEIAKELNISIHTVITHRKNITTKTGIKSSSGLVIYAISKSLVSIDDFN